MPGIPDPAPPAPRPRWRVDGPRVMYGIAVLGVGTLALGGLAAGILSQVVLFGEYDQHVEAQLYRPLILPCLVALVATGAGAAAWLVSFLRKATPAEPDLAGRRRRSRRPLYAVRRREPPATKATTT